MSNKITNWDYEPPTEPGLYLACDGDVEVPENIFFMKLIYHAGEGLIDVSDVQHPVALNELARSFKWARLLVGSAAR